jgi:hypothetical protein
LNRNNIDNNSPYNIGGVSASAITEKSLKGTELGKGPDEAVVVNGIIMNTATELKQRAADTGWTVGMYLTLQQRSVLSTNDSFVKQIDSIGFKTDGGGIYTLSTKIGGGQIEAGESIWGGYKTYDAHVWNANYNSWEDKTFDNLNAAKKYIKDKLKGY